MKRSLLLRFGVAIAVIFILSSSNTSSKRQLIMKERADWLGGTIHIAESSSGGTQVRLTFTLTGSDHNTSHESMLQKLTDD